MRKNNLLSSICYILNIIVPVTFVYINKKQSVCMMLLEICDSSMILTDDIGGTRNKRKSFVKLAQLTKLLLSHNILSFIDNSSKRRCAKKDALPH